MFSVISDWLFALKTAIKCVPCYFNKYVFETTTTSFMNNGWSLRDIYEGLFILPCNPILLFLTLRIARSYTGKNVCVVKGRDVTFSRLAHSATDKLNCDWCSVANGTLHAIGDKEPNGRLPLIAVILYVKLSQLLRRTPVPLGELTLTQLHRILDATELRWCPFKAMEECYFRNKDDRFVDHTSELMFMAGKYLCDHDTVERFDHMAYLNECFSKHPLNASSEKGSQSKDLMDDFLSRVIGILENKC